MRLDEDTLGLHGDALRIRNKAARIGFHTLGAVDKGLGAKRSQWGPAQILHRNGPGEARLGHPLARGLPEDMVEKQGADPAVHQAGRALVGRPEDELAPAPSVVLAVDDHRRGDRVAQANRRVAQRNRMAVDDDSSCQPAGSFRATTGSTPRSPPGRPHDVVVGLGPDGGIDEIPNGLGQVVRTRAFTRSSSAALNTSKVAPNPAGCSLNSRTPCAPQLLPAASRAGSCPRIRSHHRFASPRQPPPH